MKSIQETVESKFSLFLTSCLPEYPCHLIAAFSGGPDSSVLLYLLKKFQSRFSYSLTAAYINHNIRSFEVMEAEQNQLVARAQGWGIELLVKKYPPGFIDYYALKTGTSQEGAARNCRYHFFNKLKNKHKRSLLVLGHNRNDQLETLVMRIFQGTGIDGLAGIPADDGDLIRPLLDVSRADILEYADTENIPYVTDMTNETGDYRRNRIRRELVPVLFDIFPSPDKALLRVCRELHQTGKFCTDSIHWQKRGISWRLKEEDFLMLPPAVRRNILLKKMNEINRGLLPRDTRIPGRFLKPLDPLTADSSGPDRILVRGYNIELEKKDGFVILRKISGKISGGLFHVLEEGVPLVTEGFSLTLCQYNCRDKEKPAGNLLVPVKSGLSVRTGKKGAYCVLDGSETILELDKNGRIMYFMYGNQKIFEKMPNRNADCVIIKLEVNYAPGR